MTDLDDLLAEVSIRTDGSRHWTGKFSLTISDSELAKELAAAVRGLRDWPCPHIETGDDGTAFCTLAESANTAWAVRWQEQYDRAERAEVSVAELPHILDSVEMASAQVAGVAIGIDLIGGHSSHVAKEIVRFIDDIAGRLRALLAVPARPGGTDSHQPWCNKNQGPNAYAVECDCGFSDRPGGTDNPTSDEPICRTCANSGWWVGLRHDPQDCPTCGRKPYFLNGGTYPAPAPTGGDDG